MTNRTSYIYAYMNFDKESITTHDEMYRYMRSRKFPRGTVFTGDLEDRYCVPELATTLIHEPACDRGSATILI